MAFLIYSFALALPSVLALSSNTEPNCEELIKPRVLDDNYGSIMGKWILAGGVSEGIVGMIIQTMDTHWMELSPGTNNETILVRQAFSIDKICRFETMELPLTKNTVSESDSGTVQFYLLPSCSNCLTGFYSHDDRYYSSRVLLLFSRERKVSKEAKDLYQKQSECLGFPKMLIFYNDVTELCQKDTNETTDEQN
ncbi:hypothetical protein PGIGA_G00230770 [Pangasianodon gigas]|uniref:Uncharacterized protein n=1 Tax=Pangasianodon gigas TaxID=30993 RepID=A0ACC5WKS1_PANGG|nr:hypothetical protein [Pangasianodon gigas]